MVWIHFFYETYILRLKQINISGFDDLLWNSGDTEKCFGLKARLVHNS